MILSTLDYSIKKRLELTGPFWRFLFKLLLIPNCRKPLIVDLRENQSHNPYGLIVSNHLSMMDIPHIFSILTVPPIMKIEVMRIPFLGVLSKLCGSLPVDRKNPKSRQKIFKEGITRLKEEKIGLFYFAEGTRSKTGKPKNVTEIKTRLLEFAFQENIPVIPVSIYGTQNAFFKTGALRPFNNTALKISQTIYPDQFQDITEFINFSWGQVLVGFEDLEKLVTQKAN